MNVALMFLTYNRLEYTKRAIESILRPENGDFELYIWDNSSNDGTAEFVKEIKDPRVREVVLNKQNVGQAPAMNYVWGKTKAELVGKVDNDCMVPAGWLDTFKTAHKDIDKLGAIACWHFRADDFDYNLARRKIQNFGGHQVLRHPWICGTGFVIKRKTYVEMGPWDLGREVGTTYYWVKMAQAGYINGWYYPLLYQEHMDDPVSEYSNLKDDKSIQERYELTYTLRNRKIRTMEKRMRWRRKVLKNLLSDPWDVKYYTGWRGAIRKAAAVF